MEVDVQRREKIERLKKFYGKSTTVASSGELSSFNGDSDPLNIDGPKFNARQYLEHTLQSKDLSDLVSEEIALAEQIRNLDSDMQTLVYDNYSKFISATDTIRMMKSNFSYVQNEMNSLVEKMTSSASISDKINSELHDKREQLKTLTATQQTLNKISYLVELPESLKIYVEKSQWELAVQDLNKAKYTFKSYFDAPSFKSIREDCFQIVSDMITKLWNLFDVSDNLVDSAAYLKIMKRLGIHPKKLSDGFLNKMKTQMSFKLSKNETTQRAFAHSTPEILGDVPENVESAVEHDLLEFSNSITDSVLVHLTDFLKAYGDLFIADEAGARETIYDVISGTFDAEPVEFDFIESELQLCQLIEQIMTEFFNLVQQRFEMEDSSVDTRLLIRALDRIHGRVNSFNRALLTNVDHWVNSFTDSKVPTGFGSRISEYPKKFSNTALEFVNHVTQTQTMYYFDNLCRDAVEAITDLRHEAASYSIQTLGSNHHRDTGIQNIEDSKSVKRLQILFDKLSSTLITKLRDVLEFEKAFLDPETTFVRCPQFYTEFCTNQIQERLIMGYLDFLVQFFDDLAKTVVCKVPGHFLIILAKICLTWADSGTIGQLFSMTDEIFPAGTQRIHVDAEDSSRSLKEEKSLTNTKHVADRFRQTASKLLSAFVRLEGTNLAQLLRKSIEARDWLKNLEPRSVRSVVKRVIEDLTFLDCQVSELFPANSRGRDRLSDTRSVRSLRPFNSSHFYDSTRSTGSSYGGPEAELDPALATQIRRLFTQRVDIFSPVEAYRESILLGVIKIGLKTLVECARLQTFGRYGLQQIQVDCRYLQIHLWHFVNDEKLICTLLDDVIYSVVQRCFDPQLMEESIVESICDRS